MVESDHPLGCEQVETGFATVTLSGALEASAVYREVVEQLKGLGGESNPHALIIFDCTVFDEISLDILSPVMEGIVSGSISAEIDMPYFTMINRVPVFAIVTKQEAFVRLLRNAQIDAGRPFELLFVTDLASATRLTKEYEALYRERSAGRKIPRLVLQTGFPPLRLLLMAILNEFYFGRKFVDFCQFSHRFIFRSRTKPEELIRHDSFELSAQAQLEKEVYKKLAETYGPLG